MILWFWTDLRTERGATKNWYENKSGASLQFSFLFSYPKSWTCILSTLINFQNWNVLSPANTVGGCRADAAKEESGVWKSTIPVWAQLFSLPFLFWKSTIPVWANFFHFHFFCFVFSSRKLQLVSEQNLFSFPFFSTPSTEGVESTRGNSVCLSVCVCVCLSVITFSFYEYSIIWWFTLCKPYILWKFIMLATSPTLFWPSTTEYQPVPTSSDPVFNALMA